MLAAVVLGASLSTISVAQARPLGMRFHEVSGPGPTSAVTRPSRRPGRDPKLIEFDAPGAAKTSSSICKPYCGTTSSSINAQGTITGYFTDAKVVPHAFIRNPRGHVYVFDAPGAGLGAFLYQGTVAESINDRNVVAGQFEDAHLRAHGFIRYPNGTFVTVDAPGAGAKAYQGTFVNVVNDCGETAGGLYDANNVGHSFVRSAAGKITQFDPPGAVFSEVIGLNARGTTTGVYYDAGSTLHGFIRRADGTLATIDAPGALTGGGSGTEPAGIDIEGAVSGFYNAKPDGEPHGFLRYPNASLVTFVLPGSIATLVGTVNDFGTLVGGYFDAPAGGAPRGFERTVSGKFTLLDAPGAGTLNYQGTVPAAINDAGVIAGWWRTPDYVAHGFVRYP
jgi:hypothetical protein